MPKIKYWLEVILYGSLYAHTLVGALLFTAIYTWGVIYNLSRLDDGLNTIVGTFWCAGWVVICAQMLNVLLAGTPQLVKAIIDDRPH